MRLHLIRHPQPMIAPGVCYGRTDLAVTAEEVARISACLLPHLPRPASIVCSPLGRCVDLADVLVKAGGYAPAECDPNLMEMDFGTWEMRPWDGIERSLIDAWAEDMVHYRPGGGESVCDMAHRIVNFCTALEHSTHSDTVVVCHAGTIRLLLAWRAGITAAQLAHAAASKPHTIGYGEMHMVEIPTIVCRVPTQRL